MRKTILLVIITLASSIVYAQSQKVSVVNDAQGSKLLVDGSEMMINGMNWDYFPIGTNFSYSLWNQTEDLIQAALDREMSLLSNMGVNSVRMYTGVPPKWIQYIYEKYGIYTMLNHSFGRYGLTIDGAWVAITDYSNPATQELLMSEVKELAEVYKNTPGLLLYLLGNENNYGLFWAGAETEDFPEGEEQLRAVGENRGRPMYKLMNDAAVAMKGIDSSHPVAICNGDVLFLDIVAEECTDVDIYGTNMYRGASFGGAFEKVKEVYGKPIMFTEFGADAFNAIENTEDQESQAYYMVENWRDIYNNAYGLGKAGNSIGGYTFQFSDGWWKFGQTKNLDVHDNNASWANGGYARDLAEGANNMNEEWFGICAKGPTNTRGLYDLFPRAAYYALKEVHSFNPMIEGVTLASIEEHFSKVNLMDAVLKARGDKAALGGGASAKVRVSELRAELTTFTTGGDLLTTPDVQDPTQPLQLPARTGFDRMESIFVGFEAKPDESIRANVSFNILGNVPVNPINEIFYENRGLSQAVLTVSPGGGQNLQLSPNRVQLYQSEASWTHEYFNLDYFYRTGHYHWGYEGDFFGVYPEANYGPNIDLYNGFAPHGIEVEGKKQFEGLKVAFGPELWWGANPAMLLKYRKHVGKYDVTAIFHEDLDEPGAAISSIAIPVPRTRRATLYAKREFGHIGVEVGGMWGGSPLVDREFQVVRGEGNSAAVFTDQVNPEDTWGGKFKVTYQKGKLNAYAQGASMGLVAGGGADQTQTFTGWRLKDSGSGNQNNFLAGFAYTMGNWQIAPNFLWQRPLVDAIPLDAPAPARARNILDDPFVVRANREMTAGEILLTFDPTPGTWMYEWDNDRAEDASLAASLGFVYRNQPTNMDAAIIFPGTSRVPTPAPSAPPAQDIWEVYTRIVSKVNPELGIVANLYGGNGQANGPDDRVIERYGGNVRMIYKQLKLIAELDINDWGPFDYHKDFNLTFPLQVMADVSITAGKPDWFILPSTQMGLRFTWRSLDEFSPRYIYQDQVVPIGVGNGSEWEFRTYMHINIGR